MKSTMERLGIGHTVQYSVLVVLAGLGLTSHPSAQAFSPSPTTPPLDRSNSSLSRPLIGQTLTSQTLTSQTLTSQTLTSQTLISQTLISQTPGSFSNAAAVLRSGDQGDAVAGLQERLTQLGYYNGDISSYFGPLTEAAVIQFQQDNGLTADGVVGSATRDRLFPATASSPTQARSSLQEGDMGDQVTELQQRLTALGYLYSPATGYFGTETKNAVIAFQRDNGLTTDGVVGPATADALRGVSATLPQNTTTINNPPVNNPSTTSTTSSPETGSSGRLLSRGDTGADVVDLQLRLQQLGLYSGPINGNFGEQTEAAVLEFQRSRGLTQDGIVGPQVLAALYSMTSSGSATSSGSTQSTAAPYVLPNNLPQSSPQSLPPPVAPELNSAASPPSLTGRYSTAELQRRLADRGFDPGAIDGQFNSQTRQAVEEAQQDYDLAPTDLKP